MVHRITLNQRQGHVVDVQVLIDSLAVVFGHRLYRNRWWTFDQVADIINLEYGCLVSEGSAFVKGEDLTKTLFSAEKGVFELKLGSEISWATARRKNSRLKLVSLFDSKRRWKAHTDVTDNELIDSKRTKPQCDLSPTVKASFAGAFASFRIEFTGTEPTPKKARAEEAEALCADTSAAAADEAGGAPTSRSDRISASVFSSRDNHRRFSFPSPRARG